MSFHERKRLRTIHYFRYVFGMRRRPCIACAGSGIYDNEGTPPCGACDGSGWETYDGPKAIIHHPEMRNKYWP